jgi:hypothetical protein
METFIADWSSTITNWARPSATSGDQRVFGAGAVAVSRGSAAVTVARLLGAGVCPATRGAPIVDVAVSAGIILSGGALQAGEEWPHS